MSPAFSHDFLKRLSAFSKLSSGSTITLVTRNSPLSHSPKALPVYHAPLPVATGPPRAVLTGRAGCHRAGLGGRPPGTTLTRGRSAASRWGHEIERLPPRPLPPCQS